MKKIFSFTVAALLLCTGAQAQQHEADRLRHAGEVLMEILNIPDNIPKGVLDKSECVIVIPSVKKLAIGVGGNYGRGAMTLPRRPKLYRSVGAARDGCAGRRQHRLPTRRTGH